MRRRPRETLGENFANFAVGAGEAARLNGRGDHGLRRAGRAPGLARAPGSGPVRPAGGHRALRASPPHRLDSARCPGSPRDSLVRSAPGSPPRASPLFGPLTGIRASPAPPPHPSWERNMSPYWMSRPEPGDAARPALRIFFLHTEEMVMSAFALLHGNPAFPAAARELGEGGVQAQWAPGWQPQLTLNGFTGTRVLVWGRK
ncbi:uncharacterized protein [Oryctolagus cuniculus]|uniref:uncharacterized protein n=1 Tax=Oryctolagus cuniculus TaxID=9986 RepID=UPI003879A8E5